MKTFSPEHVDMANWVRAQMRDGVTRLILRQRARDAEQHVREWPIDRGTDADAVAEEIRIKASDEGRQFRGPILYGIFAYREGSSIYVDRHFFNVEGMVNGTSALITETEMADGRGLVSQMMRHTEASAKISLGQTLEIVEHYKSILRARDARIAVLEQKHAEVMELQERLLTMQHDRNLELLKEKRSDKKHAFVREKLDMLMPALMSKVLSAGTPNGQGTVLGEEILRQFLKSLGPEQMLAITNSLSPEQVVTLHEIFARYSDRETERQKAAAAAEEGEAAGMPRDESATRETSDTSVNAPEGAQEAKQEKQ